MPLPSSARSWWITVWTCMSSTPKAESLPAYKHRWGAVCIKYQVACWSAIFIGKMKRRSSKPSTSAPKPIRLCLPFPKGCKTTLGCLMDIFSMGRAMHSIAQHPSLRQSFFINLRQGKSRTLAVWRSVQREITWPWSGRNKSN